MIRVRFQTRNFVRLNKIEWCVEFHVFMQTMYKLLVNYAHRSKIYMYILYILTCIVHFWRKKCLFDGRTTKTTNRIEMLSHISFIHWKFVRFYLARMNGFVKNDRPHVIQAKLRAYCSSSPLVYVFKEAERTLFESVLYTKNVSSKWTQKHYILWCKMYPKRLKIPNHFGVHTTHIHNHINSIHLQRNHSMPLGIFHVSISCVCVCLFVGFFHVSILFCRNMPELVRACVCVCTFTSFVQLCSMDCCCFFWKISHFPNVYYCQNYFGKYYICMQSVRVLYCRATIRYFLHMPCISVCRLFAKRIKKQKLAWMIVALRYYNLENYEPTESQSCSR